MFVEALQETFIGCNSLLVGSVVEVPDDRAKVLIERGVVRASDATEEQIVQPQRPKKRAAKKKAAEPE